MLFDAAVLRPSAGKKVRATLNAQPGQKTVLVVEPNLDQADLIAKVLDAAGYAVAIAGDGRTTLMFMGDTSPDLLLLSTHLPDMTGYELTEILRAAGAYSWRLRHVNLLYLTDRDRVVNHRLIGAPESLVNSYIFRPIQEKDLLDKVRKFLDEHPAAIARKMREEKEKGKVKKAPKPRNVFADLATSKRANLR